jgi:hypothetical protein
MGRAAGVEIGQAHHRKARRFQAKNIGVMKAVEQVLGKSN